MAIRISLGLMINAGLHLASSRGSHLRWTRDRSRVNWEEFVRCQVKTKETFSEAEGQFSDRNGDVLMNVHSPISGGILLSLRCSARVRHCLRLLVGVVDWCASLLVRLI